MTDAGGSQALSLAERFPRRAGQWRLRTKTLRFGNIPALMGIVNVTPDSFSDGGRFIDHERAIEHGLQLAADGASILDVGGESTRPFADVVGVHEELRRVVPVVQALAERCQLPISIDSSKASVAKEAIAAGAEIINDISGLEADPQMLHVARQSEAGICAMHMHGTPQTMQIQPETHYQDVVEDIYRYLSERLRLLSDAGIAAERICLDPGIGFGKTHQHNLTLLAKMQRFHDLGQPLLVGHSKKGFLAKVLRDKDRIRTHANNGVSLALARSGIQVLRVHDVLSTSEALVSFAAAGGIDGQALQLDDRQK